MEILLPSSRRPPAVPAVESQEKTENPEADDIPLFFTCKVSKDRGTHFHLLADRSWRGLFVYSGQEEDGNEDGSRLKSTAT